MRSGSTQNTRDYKNASSPTGSSVAPVAAKSGSRTSYTATRSSVRRRSSSSRTTRPSATARSRSSRTTSTTRSSRYSYLHVSADSLDPKQRAPRYELDRRRQRQAEKRRAAKEKPPSEGGPIARIINGWWNRLIGALFGGSLSAESEQYLSHQTTRDYISNTVSQAVWSLMFPVLALFCTRMLGVTEAGILSLSYTIATLFFYMANYGVRTYQVSDLDELRSFWDYQINRIITCIIMLLCGYIWCKLRGYDSLTFSTCFGVIIFRAIDGFADVYEGRLQQKDKLYLAGISQTLRCVCGFFAFLIMLFFTHDLGAACYAMCVGAFLTLIVVTIPLAFFETARSLAPSLQGLGELFTECFPLFLALFLYSLIDAMPQIAMDSMLSADNQLYYSLIYYPPHMIAVFATFLWKPQLLRLAHIWEDPRQRSRFDLMMLVIIGGIALICGAMALFMATLGIPLISYIYEVDFAQFTGLVYTAITAGGIAACVDFLYQIITLLRAQRRVGRLYLIAIVFCIPVVFLLVYYSGLAGAVLGIAVSMAILFVLLTTEYFSIRKQIREEL